MTPTSSRHEPLSDSSTDDEGFSSWDEVGDIPSGPHRGGVVTSPRGLRVSRSAISLDALEPDVAAFNAATKRLSAKGVGVATSAPDAQRSRGKAVAKAKAVSVQRGGVATSPREDRTHSQLSFVNIFDLLRLCGKTINLD